jgi:hypothetical protein
VQLVFGDIVLLKRLHTSQYDSKCKSAQCVAKTGVRPFQRANKKYIRTSIECVALCGSLHCTFLSQKWTPEIGRRELIQVTQPSACTYIGGMI